MAKKYLKVALITGAARRIGAHIATHLHAHGMNIVLHYHRSEKAANALCRGLNKKRPQSATIAYADLSVLSDIDALTKKAHQAWGQLDVLVNNASTFYKTPVGKIKEMEWNTLIDTNLKAPFFLAQSAFPFLKKQKGCIINIVDIHHTRPMKDYSVYSISKAGLHMLTLTLAREMGPFVRVNAVSPGAIIWPEGKNTLPEKQKKKILDHSAMKKAGHPDDIAKAVLFLVNDAPYVTGQDIAVDGGRSLFI